MHFSIPLLRPNEQTKNDYYLMFLNLTNLSALIFFSSCTHLYYKLKARPSEDAYSLGAVRLPLHVQSLLLCRHQQLHVFHPFPPPMKAQSSALKIDVSWQANDKYFSDRTKPWPEGQHHLQLKSKHTWRITHLCAASIIKQETRSIKAEVGRGCRNGFKGLLFLCISTTTNQE